MTDLGQESVLDTAYLRRTPRSAELMDRARRSLPGGTTRTFGYFDPHPPVFERAAGPYLYDVDGNRYVDLIYSGQSLIHGHAYPPIVAALKEAVDRGTAWPGTSVDQIEFAERLCARIPTADLVRLTNSGTEATMLAVKLARHSTGRPLVLKSWDAYHGSYDDLESGLYGNGELAGRTLLARFGDLEAYERILAERGAEVAAVILEPVLYTFRIVPPPADFLRGVAELARKAGAVVILDDTIMLRLALGGSAEKYDFAPDLTCLGKWVAGGVPIGVVAGQEELLRHLDTRRPRALYHGGSFNGNPLACAAGCVTLDHVGIGQIELMDRYAEQIASALVTKARELALPIEVSGVGSVRGVYVLNAGGTPDRTRGRQLQRAALNHGVYFGQDGELTTATVFTDEVAAEAIRGLDAALEDLRYEIDNEGNGHGS
jgi:glutamate-1-semialdehyde 2,1-aminomutase